MAWRCKILNGSGKRLASGVEPPPITELPGITSAEWRASQVGVQHHAKWR
jgi:hypothetical protein